LFKLTKKRKGKKKRNKKEIALSKRFT